MMTRLVIIISLFAFMQAASSFTPGARATGGAVLGFGFMLLTAFFSGRVFAELRLPKLTGYIACGILVGPYALDLVDTDMVSRLRIFNNVAISLIALTAGAEMNVREFRPLLRTVGYITLVGVLGTTVLLGTVLFFARSLLPFFAELSTGQALAVAFTIGVTVAAQSPAVVVALRDELRADGPVTRTVLGVVVLADFVIIVCFAIASAIAQFSLGEGADVGETVGRVSWELFGSIGIGAVAGLILSFYLSRVREGVGLFVLLLCVAIAEVGVRLHLDPLLIALGAGIVVQNVGRVAEPLLHAIHDASLPIYVVFFATAGATIHLDVIPSVAAPAVLLIATRALGLLAGSRLGARLAGADPAVQRFAGFGLLPQAGLALALALLFARTFPSFGEGAQALILSIVAINEILAPAFYRYALIRSGEATSTGRDAEAGGH